MAFSLTQSYIYSITMEIIEMQTINIVFYQSRELNEFDLVNLNLAFLSLH